MTMIPEKREKQESEREEKEKQEKEKRVICALAGDFPLTEEPYKALAAKADLTEAEFLQTARKLLQEGKIRKMGAVLGHRKAGFTANALCAWQTPPERAAEVARSMSANPAVTHCYERQRAANWPYNVYTMIHGATEAQCEAIAKQMATDNNLSDQDRIMLYTLKEWKKTSLNYFHENQKLG